MVRDNDEGSSRRREQEQEHEQQVTRERQEDAGVGSLNKAEGEGDSMMTNQDENEIAETKALLACWDEALWRRALPWAAASAGTTLAAVSVGLLKPSARFGPWPKCLGVAFVGFWAGRLSYLVGEKCQDKFLEMAPAGDMAKTIREIRTEGKVDVDMDVEPR